MRGYEITIIMKIDLSKMRRFWWEDEQGNVLQLDSVVREWEDSMVDAEKHYMNMIKLGATPQIARSVLPNSTKTNITITANYREWRHYFKLRCATAAHPQIREVSIELLRELKKRIPVIFDDIMPEEGAE